MVLQILTLVVSTGAFGIIVQWWAKERDIRGITRAAVLEHWHMAQSDFIDNLDRRRRGEAVLADWSEERRQLWGLLGKLDPADRKLLLRGLRDAQRTVRKYNRDSRSVEYYSELADVFNKYPIDVDMGRSRQARTLLWSAVVAAVVFLSGTVVAIVTSSWVLGVLGVLGLLISGTLWATARTLPSPSAEYRELEKAP